MHIPDASYAGVISEFVVAVILGCNSKTVNLGREHFDNIGLGKGFLPDGITTRINVNTWNELAISDLKLQINVENL